ncbi:Anthranilate synthase component 1 [Salmonella enterica subsp. enterica]|uniref:Anthranilate synthase component 1 n=1 Tax=Salmonella enterica I TaxID=59201 RepID=A0A447U2F6_SALET|nr:Anthranilate synthase component 1 [Salmonella enterica subsp. enterica]
MVIDHQKKSTRIQASLFTASDREKQRLNARLAYLSQQLTQPAPPLPVTPVPDMRCECNQSDDAFGAVVRQFAKSHPRGRDISGGAVAPLFTALARRRWLPTTC